jgi:hypothetical protein
MGPERQKRLDDIGFEFKPKDRTKEEKWNAKFKNMRDYYEKHGHCELFWLSTVFS